MTSFAVHIPDAALEPDPLDPEQIVEGAPEVSGAVLWESEDGKQIRGIWQITPGVVTDVEGLPALDRDRGPAEPRSRSRAGRPSTSAPVTPAC
jgi:hypothetical protein